MKSLNIWLIFEITANITSFTGLCLNLLLLFMIFKKTTKLLAEYKIILLQNCIIDMFFTGIDVEYLSH